MTAKRELLKVLAIMVIIPVILLGWMIVRASQWIVSAGITWTPEKGGFGT